MGSIQAYVKESKSACVGAVCVCVQFCVQYAYNNDGLCTAGSLVYHLAGLL